MNFFEKQEIARRKTGLLVVYFLASVIFIIAAVYFSFNAIYYYFDQRATENLVASGYLESSFKWWDPELFLVVASITLAVIIIGTIYKIIVLSGGGKAVAEMLGGRLVEPGTKDSGERRLLNIVEEISIASGISVPAVYILDGESSINAFAAGVSPGDAVIGVTKGCIEILSRDELQGVIAHEFSHILNGDMRLNIRLMGVLHGILVLSIIGYILLRTRGRKNPLPLFGAALLAIGYIGVFFGRLIKAAVSRQREFLADAAAVQFTRNPDGISGALKKIGALAYGSKISNPKAEEASHFYFANGVTASLTGLMATHPPLVARIKRIDPSFDGNFGKANVKFKEVFEEEYDEKGGERFTSVSSKVAFNPAKAVNQIGTILPEQLIYASTLIASLPQEISSNIRSLEGAKAVVYALLVDKNSEVERKQLDYLQNNAAPVFNETKNLLPYVKALGPEKRLPVVDMAISVLRGLSKEEYDVFIKNIRYLVKADNKTELFEFMLEKILEKHLGSRFKGKKRAAQYGALHQLRPECQMVLSSLAHLGGKDAGEASRAYLEAWTKLPIKGGPADMLSSENVSLEKVGDALDKLSVTEMKLRKNILEACVTCVAFDNKITVEEGELIRAICDTFDSPMPPIL